MSPADSREIARRQHRAFANFAALQCWITGSEGLVIKREDLERYLGLEKFKDARLIDIVDDMKAYFPHHIIVYDDRDLFVLLVLSRLKLPYTTERAIKRANFWWYTSNISFDAHQIKIFELWSLKESKDFPSNALTKALFGSYFSKDENLVLAFSSLLAQGNISPLDIPGFKPKEVIQEEP